MKGTLSFKALLEPDDTTTATFVTIPFDVPEVFGTRARVPVRGTINGFPFRSSLFPMGGRFLLIVNRALREGARVHAGDLVDVDLERDIEPRVIEPPPDLAEALRTNPAAKAAWEKLSYSHRKEYALAIEDAKKPDTRARRVAKAIQEMLAKRNDRTRSS
jgi:hypothetical protein